MVRRIHIRKCQAFHHLRISLRIKGDNLGQNRDVSYVVQAPVGGDTYYVHITTDLPSVTTDTFCLKNSPQSRFILWLLPTLEHSHSSLPFL
jgi:hypothetical protein